MKEQTAKKLFRSGLNCAQTVLAAYAGDFKLDADMAQSISCGFGAGMGKLQKTCGAVTGSFMVLGLYNSQKYQENQERKEKTSTMIQSFSDKFLSAYGTMECRELLNCDLKTDEGRKYANENNLFGSVCEKCIVDSVKILNELMD